MFWHFLLGYCLGFHQIKFGENPTEIGQLVPKIQTVKGLNKQKETKETICFVWLYVKNSICKFRLILLDHITNVIVPFLCVPGLPNQILREASKTIVPFSYLLRREHSPAVHGLPWMQKGRGSSPGRGAC